jgi:hypothetical protein
MVCPETGESFSVPELRGDKKIDGKTVYGLRLWENEDLVPRPDDVFQERLYCVRWVETYSATNAQGESVEKTRRHYCAVTAEDLQREQKVLGLLTEPLANGQGQSAGADEPVGWDEERIPAQSVVNAGIRSSSQPTKSIPTHGMTRFAYWSGTRLYSESKY